MRFPSAGIIRRILLITMLMVAVGYNVGVAIFGGFTPLVVDWLINLTGHAVAPAYWVMFAAVVSLVSLLILRTRYGKR